MSIIQRGEFFAITLLPKKTYSQDFHHLDDTFSDDNTISKAKFLKTRDCCKTFYQQIEDGCTLKAR